MTGDQIDLGLVVTVFARLFFEQYAPRLASGAPLGSDGWFAPASASPGDG